MYIPVIVEGKTVKRHSAMEQQSLRSSFFTVRRICRTKFKDTARSSSKPRHMESFNAEEVMSKDTHRKHKSKEKGKQY